MNEEIQQLRARCLASIEDYKNEGVVYKTPSGMYVFKDNGSKVLAVAHLDTVKHTRHFRYREKEKKIFCGQLDDRAGAWVILDRLPKMGINVDVLLTEGEETGQTTAAHFKTDKKYNFIFSFDRRGDDVVGYSYEDEVWREIVKSVGFRPSGGSFSDISRMTGLGCKGFNFGVGYMNEHRDNHFIDLGLLEGQLRRFQKFWENYNDVAIPHTVKTYNNNNYNNYNPYNYNNYHYKGPSFIDANVIFDFDPEVLIRVSGYKEVIVPLSELLDMVSLWELKNIVKNSAHNCRIDRKYLDSYLEVEGELD